MIEKYRVVHEINRAGSMLDNVMYFNLRLDRDLFEPALLEEILREAGGSVQVEGDGVFIRSLIVQLKIIPLPVYLETANETETQAVIASLGHCIRNNAATNIFNKDLDSRNYGVGRYGRVFLFDYDAVEKLTDVKIRTNSDREPGEEAVPDWYFEDGVIFLPEELEYGMQLKNDFARRCFRKQNADLLGVEYWQRVQQKLQRGEVPELRVYPRAARLSDADSRLRRWRRLDDRPPVWSVASRDRLAGTPGASPSLHYFSAAERAHQCRSGHRAAIADRLPVSMSWWRFGRKGCCCMRC